MPDVSTKIAVAAGNEEATTRGLAPAAADCTSLTVGSRSSMPYTADYYFWESTGS